MNRIESIFGGIGWRPRLFRLSETERTPCAGSGYAVFSPDSKFCVYAGWSWSTRGRARVDQDVADAAERDLLLPPGDMGHAEWIFSERGLSEAPRFFTDPEDSPSEWEIVTGEIVPDSGYASLEEIALVLTARGLFSKEAA
jgi:hypothetical protein